MGFDMRYSIPGLGGRLQRARKSTGMSQDAVAKQVGVSWMTVHRWERSQRGVPDHLLHQVCEVYERSLRWFLTLEDGDLEDEQPVAPGSGMPTLHRGTEAAERISRKIGEAPASQRGMIEKVVEDMLDGLKRAS